MMKNERNWSPATRAVYYIWLGAEVLLAAGMIYWLAVNAG